MRLLAIALLNLSLTACVVVQQPQTQTPDPLPEAVQVVNARIPPVPVKSAPPLLLPDSQSRDLGFNYTLYKRGDQETLVNPFGARIPLSPDGMFCQEGNYGADCQVKHFVVRNKKLYLVLTGHVIEVGPDGRDFREVPLSSLK